MLREAVWCPGGEALGLLVYATGGVGPPQPSCMNSTKLRSKLPVFIILGCVRVKDVYVPSTGQVLTLSVLGYVMLVAETSKRKNPRGLIRASLFHTQGTECVPSWATARW